MASTVLNDHIAYYTALLDWIRRSPTVDDTSALEDISNMPPNILPGYRCTPAEDIVFSIEKTNLKNKIPLNFSEKYKIDNYVITPHEYSMPYFLCGERLAQNLFQSPSLVFEQIDNMYRTPLLLRATEMNNQASVALLLNHKADPDMADEIGRVPLSLAAVTNPAIVQLFIDHKADLNVQKDNPLHRVMWCFA